MEIYNKMKANSITGYVQSCDKAACSSGNVPLGTHVLVSHSSYCRCYMRKQNIHG